MSTSYDCSQCGALDSTRCDVLPGAGVADRRIERGRPPYTKRELDAARAVGCRVVHYIDLRRADVPATFPSSA